MRTRRRGWSGGLVAAVVAMAIALGGCGVLAEERIAPTPTPRAENTLSDPGFEAGGQGWRLLPGQEPVAVSDERARSGERALRLDAGGGTMTAAQLLPVDALPEFVSGHYYVESWDDVPEGELLYLQLIVSVRRTDMPARSGGQELHLILGGTNDIPQGLDDWRYHFLSRDDPERDEWVYFGYPLRKAFQQAFQWTPASFESFEVRLELTHGGPAGAAPPEAVVYFDDLYVGAQAGAPADE